MVLMNQTSGCSAARYRGLTALIMTFTCGSASLHPKPGSRAARLGWKSLRCRSLRGLRFFSLP